MILLASTPAPTTDGGSPNPDLVTPGTIGFLATLAVVVVTIFLIRDALRRVRRVRARSGASDAYPIPLRRHVVPNQSKLSGPDEPEQAQKPAGNEATGNEAAGDETPGAKQADEATEATGAQERTEDSDKQS
ncbi:MULTISPECIES: hypothetical protein [unclassified Brevibacterium]|jgi:hypothetical protein|uniref:hypothetical protein n=1 Tax=unclassified Brevibacterium TaxID=2614124 RepID=UPI001F0DA930|nr:hypothetical protein [Brevibacterium sp. S111]